MSILTEAARGQECVWCGQRLDTVVLAHYTGARRLDFGGGLGIKVNDLVAAHLCEQCHKEMDTHSRDKAKKWEHSEAFLHLCMLTILRLYDQGILIIKGERK